MDKKNYIDYIVRYFPLLFFLFITLFILVKFLMIVLFRAAFEPQFILNLTPYYLLSGTNSLDLLLLSLLVVIFDVYLHINVSKKNLMLSFIPTIIMLSGLGISIASGTLDASYVIHFLIFGCLILIALIDQKQILIFQESNVTPKIEQVVTKTTKDNSFLGMEAPDRQFPIFGQPQAIRIEGLDELLTLHKQTLIDLRTVLKEDIKITQNLMGDLEKKTEKINILSEELEQRRKNLIEDEKLYRNRFSPHTSTIIEKKPVVTKVKPITEEKTEEILDNEPTMLNDFLGSAVVVKRGVLKQVSKPFLELLGYDLGTLLEKNIADFIAPENISEFKKEYTNKLKSKTTSSYDTVFLTKDNKKIHVEITMRPMMRDKKTVDLILIRKLK